MKLIFISLLVLAQSALAADTKETPIKDAEMIEYRVEGMHCAGCKKMITKSVCDDKEMNSQFEKCEVELVDAKKQIGKIKIKPKQGQTVDAKAVEASVKKAGDYKIVPPEMVK